MHFTFSTLSGLALLAGSSVYAAPAPAVAAASSDPAIILGKYTSPGNLFAAYAAWPSESSPCTSATLFALEAPVDQGLCNHPFTAGTNPNYTNVEATDCASGFPNIEPVKKNASPVQLCQPLTPNSETCPNGVGSFDLEFLCGGPLNTGK